MARYRPIREVKRSGTVSRSVIQKAVQKIADLRLSDPTTYRSKINSGSGKQVRLVVKHT